MADYLQSKNLSDAAKQATQDASDATKLAQSGVGDSVKREAYPERINSVAEKVYSGYNNSHIILGKDRIDDTWTGYGGRGYPESGMVHIVAGHFGAGLGLYSEDPSNPVTANPNFMLDSAYIYISQTADIDDYLSLKDGKVGKSIKKAAIAIKADDVRIIGERGIKLVTRRYNEDSKREKHINFKGIDLIAGNDDKELQPMLKGDNTILAMRKLIELFELTLDTVMEIVYHQADVDESYASHQHMTSVAGSPTLPVDDDVLTRGLKANYVFTQFTNRKLDAIRKDLSGFKETYLEKTGETYIASRFNNTN
jgi:hypothetical protein